MQSQLPEKWKDWTIKRLLGKGAYGKVYMLERAGEVTALKIITLPEDQSEYELLLREYLSDHALKQYFQDMIRHLKDEITIMMEIREHPGVVKLLDYEVVEESDGTGFSLYMQMEYLTPLSTYLEKHFLTEEDYIRLAIELCEVLQYCHKKELIHRDIKPDNIFLTEDGHVKLGDFGMARYLDHNKRSMSVKGSTAYMAPEVFFGKRYDQRVDEYSLALTLYRELNRGREPFVPNHKSVITFVEKEEANKKRLNGEKIPAPLNCSIPLWKILRKALSPLKEDRYDTIEAMKQDLISLSEGQFKWTRLNSRQIKTVKMVAGFSAAFFCLVGGMIWYSRAAMKKQVAEEAKIREMVLDYDERLWEILGERDYAAFSEDFTGYSKADFEKICDLCYDETLKERHYTHLLTKDGEHFEEVLHYHKEKEYPDPQSRVDARRITLVMKKDGPDYYFVTEDDNLIKAQLSTMPEGYQGAALDHRNTEEYTFAHHWQDEDLTFDGVVGFEITSLWQNADQSLTAEVLIMNGTGEKRIINDMDYAFTDAVLGLIAQGNCGDEYEAEPGKSIHFQIQIPAEEVLTGWNLWTEVENIFEPNID